MDNTQTDIRYPDVTVQLAGQDGNVFMIIGGVRKALRRAGVPQADLDGFTADVMAAESYDAALVTVMRWVTVA